ncbi:MAG: metalloprotease TldD [Micavibrio aeruginosavorus]|nr:metalloprotease TldD [Micavibrio aeruginosavorus]
MSDPRSVADAFFFTSTGLDPQAVTRRVQRALHGADGGELYMSHSVSRTLSWSDGKLRANYPGLSEGFMLRYVVDDAEGYAASNDFSERSLAAAARGARQIRTYRTGTGGIVLPAAVSPTRFYTMDNPLDDVPLAQRIKLLEDIDQQIRSAEPSITQVSMTIATQCDVVTIIRQDGQRLDDIRPMTTLSLSLIASKDGRTEAGRSGYGARGTLSDFFNTVGTDALVARALGQVRANLQAIPAPSGEMPVILGPGAAAVMLHEAVGHGLEGDFNRLGSSAFSGKVGKRVASKGVTVIDQGNLSDAFPGHRGSLMFDDEGVPTTRTVLIEDGILKGYMQDSKNARLMNVAPTGNGRRQGYESLPIPRMTTTYMLAGQHTQAEMIASIKGRAIFAKEFAGGQVDITNGKFVFDAQEAYLVEDGKIIAPVKGVSLIGDGPAAMKKIDMIGNDLVIDKGTWTCGKSGQSVPVGVGQPSLLMRGITVGGTSPG